MMTLKILRLESTKDGHHRFGISLELVACLNVFSMELSHSMDVVFDEQLTETASTLFIHIYKLINSCKETVNIT